MSTVTVTRKPKRASQGTPQVETVEKATPEHRRVPAWGVIFWLALIHLGALAGPWTFTWEGIALALVLHWATGGLGICLGYHRLLTHSSFQTYRWVRWVFALLGGLAGEGSAVDWVANHRKHHALSDQPGDPHSPRDGAWWSHVFWLAFNPAPSEHQAHLHKWVPDLLKDPVTVWIGRLFLPLHIVSGLAIMGLGYAYGEWVSHSTGPLMAASFLVWGVFLRLVFVLHSTWFVNSASHMWGYTNYETTDDSKNNWWVALISYGEGWHNNHHAYPRMALHGHKWWEFDATWLAIRCLRACGLAWNIVDYKHRNEAAT